VSRSERAYPNRGLHGRVVHEIGLRIVSGQFNPGEVLPNEAELGEELAVSRSVLRESMKVLAGKGLVEVRTKTGTRVRPRRDWHLLDPDVLSWQFEEAVRPKDLYDLVELRLIVEPSAAHLAAERHTEEELQAIKASFVKMEEHVADPESFIAADLEFHRAIFDASANEFLQQIVNVIGVALRAARRVHTREPARYEPSLLLHQAVLVAITAGNGPRAADAMRVLIEGARRDMEHYLKDAILRPSRGVRISRSRAR
jgi:DNA-binding FadR family transcriptional regulator